MSYATQNVVLPVISFLVSHFFFTDQSTVEIPVNDVNIRRRRYYPSSGYSYTAYNNDFKITKTGKLTKWRFYSSYSGDIYFQVWRFDPSE